MKSDYLNAIKQLLNNYRINSVEKDDIVNDYDRMYDDGLAKGMSDEDVVAFLGTPEKVVIDLSENYREVKKPKNGEKLIAIMPFVSLIVFFVLGYYFSLWHPGWMVFLSIPVVAIIVEMGQKKDRNILTALSPFISVLTYLLIGFIAGIWHPTWLVFLLTPIVAIVTSGYQGKPIETLTALSPFVAVIVFFILGQYNYWHPGWLVFFIIPMLGILNSKTIWKILVYELAFLIAIGLYFFLGYMYGEWGFGLLVFLIPFVLGLALNDINLVFDGMTVGEKIVLLATIAIYLILGFLFNSWGYMWLIFFLIPVYSIFLHSPKSGIIIAISPFVSFAIFYYLGYFLDLWNISWMAFLLIPITAIIVGKK